MENLLLLLFESLVFFEKQKKISRTFYKTKLNIFKTFEKFIFSNKMLTGLRMLLLKIFEIKITNFWKF